MGRWIRFLIAIAIGIGLGLLYAWVLNPVEVVDTTPDTLHIDYKTDYVLMVAEVYEQDANPERAARSLALLGEESPSASVEKAIARGTALIYDPADLTRMRALLEGLQTWNPGVSEGVRP